MGDILGGLGEGLRSILNPQPAPNALNSLLGVGDIPPAGSSPGIAGGMFGGEGQRPMERWDPESMARAIGSADIADSAGIGQPDGDYQAVVEGFKPKKRSFWGMLGDAVLLGQKGYKGPYFADRIDKKNMERAFEGFTHDPMETVRRVATFNPEAAMKLYNVVHDNQNMDRLRQQQEAVQELRFRNMLASMFSVATPETYGAIYNRGKTMADRLGYDISDISPEYNKVAIDSMRSGALTVDQQLDNERMDRNTDSLIGTREASEERQSRNTENMIGNRNTRTQEYLRRGREPRKSGSAAPGKGEPGLDETDVVRPGERMQIMREGGRIVAARVLRKDRYDRDTYVLLSPAALAQLKKKMGQ